MNEPKICPLLVAGDPAPLNVQCKGDRCAWWNGDCCAVLSMAIHLEGIDVDGITTHEG